MAKARNELSVADLQRLLERKQARLAALLKKRQSLQKTLAKVEKQIAGLEGSKSRSGTQKRRRKPGRRVKNARPLNVVVTEILSKTKAGLKVADLTVKVLATGTSLNPPTSRTWSTRHFTIPTRSCGTR